MVIIHPNHIIHSTHPRRHHRATRRRSRLHTEHSIYHRNHPNRHHRTRHTQPDSNHTRRHRTHCRYTFLLLKGTTKQLTIEVIPTIR